MAQVIVAGDTSGTVTLQAPAVAGSTTINLPTVSGGSFVVSDASGNVGIGTSSPSYKLDIATSANGRVLFNQLSTGGQPRFATNLNGTTNVVTLETYGASTDPALAFSTASTERMRIDSSGNLLVGTTSAVRSGDRVSVVGAGAQIASFQNSTNTSGFSALSTLIQANGNNTSTYHLWANTNSVGNWYLYGNGTSSFSSDERLKKNIETTRNGYVEDLCKLRVVKYNWKNDSDDTPKEIGLIAQEVEQVFAGLVQEDLNPVEDGGEKFKQLKASVLPFMLLKAIQEQQAMIASQSELITQLQAQLTAVSADVAALKGTA